MGELAQLGRATGLCSCVTRSNRVFSTIMGGTLSSTILLLISVQLKTVLKPHCSLAHYIEQRDLTYRPIYADTLTAAHIPIAGFGGAFLFLVAFGYFFYVEKDVHWVKYIEAKLTKLGEIEVFGIILTLSLTS